MAKGFMNAARQAEAVTIRPATALDAVNIAKLLKRTLGADQDALRVNDQKTVKWVMDTLETAFVAVADLSGRVVGSIAMLPMQQPWSDDWFMGEAWYAVKPSVQTEGTAADLLEQAEMFADKKRIPLFFKVPAGDVDKETLLSSRLGYHHMGNAYFRSVPSRSRDGREESALAT